MRATMMHSPLTIAPFLERAATMFADIPLLSRRLDKRIDRSTLGEFARNATSLASGLLAANLRPGDRVATLMWNHAEHVAAYFGIPLAAGVLHTLNIRLHPKELAYIVDHAGDRFVLVDEILFPLWEKVAAHLERPIERVYIARHSDAPLPPNTHDLAELLQTPHRELPILDENQPLGMCYTSGTTGAPKGVVYSHRSIALHSFAVCMSDGLALAQRDVVLPVVPMFHANAWGIPFAAVMCGATMVMPGPHLDAISLLDLMAAEKVTLAAGVPTIWGAILAALDQAPTRWQLRTRMVVGGAAVPESLLRGFDRHGMTVLHAWGMTETAPLGSVSYQRNTDAALDENARYAKRARQGYPAPFVEFRAIGENGVIPWDDVARGELEVRGPWVAASYHEQSDNDGKWADGWFRTGDVVTIDAQGSLRIVDRAKDLIKSGGEWISSVDLENALVGHASVLEAAVIAVPHPRWSERPLAVVKLKVDAAAKLATNPSDEPALLAELRAHLAALFAKFCVPEAIVIVDDIPKTSTGKYLKTALRERFASWQWDA